MLLSGACPTSCWVYPGLLNRSAAVAEYRFAWPEAIVAALTAPTAPISTIIGQRRSQEREMGSRGDRSLSVESRPDPSAGSLDKMFKGYSLAGRARAGEDGDVAENVV